MCISNTNDNVWHWWCYRSLLLFPLLCCWCHSLAPQDQAPFPPTSQLSYKYDCWWSSWCEVTTADFMTSYDKKNMYQIDQESCVSGYQGLGERFHQVSFPNHFGATIWYFEVHSCERYDPDAEWQFTNMTPKQKECARAEQDSEILLEKAWENWDVYISKRISRWMAMNTSVCP